MINSHMIKLDVPDWRPYAAEFPHWHVWRGVCGLVYARRPRTGPPVVVRGEDAVDLRHQMRRAEGRMTSFKGSNPELRIKSRSEPSASCGILSVYRGLCCPRVDSEWAYVERWQGPPGHL